MSDPEQERRSSWDGVIAILIVLSVAVISGAIAWASWYWG